MGTPTPQFGATVTLDSLRTRLDTFLTRGCTTRFAPAPTGFLHLGHVANAVWVWGIARAYDGRVLLRVEDHDRSRCRPEHEVALLEDLDWLGLVPDGATTEVFRRGAHPQRQSDNVSRYTARIAELTALGLAYACVCSRAEIARAGRRNDALAREPTDAPVDHELRYPGTCRASAIPADATTARRVVVAAGTPEHFDDLRLGPQARDPEQQCGDLLARDRLGNWTYQFAVTVDDLEQGIDLVIRGEDLLDSTGRQLRLARLLGRTSAPRFLHHPLLRHPDGRKLSKSSDDSGVRELRAAGLQPAAVLGRAAFLSGLQPAPTALTPDSLAALFR